MRYLHCSWSSYECTTHSSWYAACYKKSLLGKSDKLVVDMSGEEWMINVLFYGGLIALVAGLVMWWWI